MKKFLLSFSLCKYCTLQFCSILFLFFISTSYAQELTLSNKGTEPGGSPTSPEGEVEIHYDGDNTSAVGAANTDFIIAARFTTTQTGAVVGEYIKKVRVYIFDPTVGNTATVRIYSQGTPTAPGAELYNQPFNTTSNSWNEVVLNTPVLVPNADIWVGVQAIAGPSGSQFWGGTDAGPNHPDGQWIFFGGAWATLVSLNPALTFNWNVRAVVDQIVGPGQATNPSPVHGATGVGITGVNLSWTNPVGANTNEVYFGTNPGSLTLIHSGSLAATVNAPSPLNYFTDYYWRVDEIGTGGTTTGATWNFKTQANPAGVFLPYSQSFNAASFPEHWSQTISGAITTNRWAISPTNVAGGTPNEIFATWVQAVGTSRLILGPINTPGMTSLGLSFRQFFDDFDVGVSYKIQSSMDGTAWTDEAFNFASGNGNAGPEMVNTTIANNVGSTTYIAWVLDGDHYQLDFWIIDDVTVYQQFTNDVATTSIDLASTLPTGNFLPQAKVTNLGTATNTFNVQMTITGGYNSTKTVTSLAPGATQQVTFDNWNATGGAYTINVCTQLGTDQNTSNDCMNKNVNVSEGWTHQVNFPDATYLGSGAGYMSSTEATGYLFSIGGNTNSLLGTECFKYNVNANSWSPISPLPSGRRVLATAVVGDFLYAIGGSDTGSVYQSTVYRYDIAGNVWTTVASLPDSIAWGKAVGYNNRIYFAGGYDGTNVLSSVFVYDVSGNTWTSATPMPGPKFGGAFSISGNKLVYVGGADLSVISNSVYVGVINTGDPLSIAWTEALNRYPGLQKEIPFQQNINLTELNINKQNFKRENFIPVETTSYPPGAMYRFDGAAWGADGIIVAGGSPASAFVPAVPNPCYVYKPDTDTWVQQGEVPTAVLGSSLGSVNEGGTWKLIVASGLGTSDVTSVTQVFADDLGGGSTTFQLTVNVNNGWNMVSIPGLHPANQQVLTWWPGKDPGANVFRYSGGYQSITNAAPTEGYWMKNAGTQTYNTGDEWPAGGINIVPHNSIPGATGWNLIGGYEYNALVSGITTSPSGLVEGSVFGYSGGYQAASELLPGYGYWIKLSAAGDIILPPPTFKGSAKIAAIGEDLPKGQAGWGKIIVTDNAGVSYTLYSVKGEVNLSAYELPPLPPEGMFDVRFNSGRYAEDLGTGTQQIDLSGIVYPVKIKAEGISFRIQDVTGKIVNERIKSGEEVTISQNINKLNVTKDIIPDAYSLEQNYPNPFNPATIIEFAVPEDVKNVKLTIYSALGEKVAELINGSYEAGYYQYQWNAANYASGLYIYELKTEKFVSIKKMMLMK